MDEETKAVVSVVKLLIYAGLFCIVLMMFNNYYTTKYYIENGYNQKVNVNGATIWVKEVGSGPHTPDLTDR